MNPSYSSSFSKERDLLSRLFFYNQDRQVWVYIHDDQVFRVMAACAKMNVPCRNIPKDDPNTIEITNEDWERIFALPSLTDSPEPPSQEAIMKMKSSESTDTKTSLKEKHNTESKVRYYRFNGTHDESLDSKSEDLLMAAESQMNDEEEHDMETALHALAERTSAVIINQDPTKEEDDADRSFVPFSAIKGEETIDSLPAQSHSSHQSKDVSMIQDQSQTLENTTHNKPFEGKHFGELSSWEQVLEDRESTLAAREKVLRLRQKDVQDMEERLYEERKTFNADYEEKKAFLEDKEQHLKKIFERLEEIGYEFRRGTRTDGKMD